MGGLQEKADRILALRPDAVHLGVCTLGKDRRRCETIQRLAGFFPETGIPVLNGTRDSRALKRIGEPVGQLADQRPVFER